VAISKFAGEDEAFRAWIGRKPKGYVLNTHREYPDRENTRLHRASCYTLELGFGGGRAQTAEQIKVCSPDPKELNEWARANLELGLRGLRCQHCEPGSLGLTD
jgi:hypothetical protein